MKKWLSVCSLAVFVLCLTGPGPAQARSNSRKSQFPLELSFFNHAVTMPFNGIILKPLHPGFSIGTEYRYSEGKLGCIYQSLHTGYYFNKYNARGLYIQTELGYRYTADFGLFGDLTLGAGYLHSFHPKEVFKLNSQGEYEKAKDKGKPGAIILVSLGLGYDFSRKFSWPVSFFFRFQPYFQTPYNLETSVFPQAMVHFGIRVQL